MQDKMVLHITALDYRGGAARCVYKIHKGLEERRISSFMLVEEKSIKDDDSIISIHKNSRVERVFDFLNNGFTVTERIFGFRVISYILRRLLESYKRVDERILSTFPIRPTIIHANNIYHNYFSLNSLPYLSSMFPFIYTLHDPGSFTGHCGYYFDCYRWESGCGKCPYLHTFPGMGIDRTASNLEFKRKIYSKSSFYLVTPSKWLMDSALRSILKPAIKLARVIPNGVELDIFYPAEDDQKKEALRAGLGFSKDDIIVSFVAAGTRYNPFKDYETVRRAVSLIGNKISRLVFLAIGGNRTYQEEGENGEKIYHIKYERDPVKLADYYRISDIYVHGAKMDNLPGVVIEALACGIPCIGTSVGGIPEIINGLSGVIEDSSNTHSLDTATGVLTPLSNAHSMASAIEYLIKNADIRKRLSSNASLDAKSRFSQELCTARYLEFYKEAEADFLMRKQ